MNDCIGSINVSGWYKKRPLVEHLISTEKIQILALSELNLRRNGRVKVPNFYSHLNLKNGKGVGILSASHLEAVPFCLPECFNSLQVCGVSITTPHGPVHFFSIYVPPNSPLPVNFLQYVASLNKAVLLGDFNARHVSFSDTATNAKGTVLINQLAQLNVCRITNMSPTFVTSYGASIIDHIIVSSSLISRVDPACYVGPTVTSDHLPLLLKCDLFAPFSPPSHIISRPDWKHANWDLFKGLVEETLPPPPSFTPNTIEDCLSEFNSCIQEATAKAVPKRHINTQKPPLPPNIIALIKEKRKIYREFTRTHDPSVKKLWNRQNALIRRLTISHKEKQWADICSSLDYREGAKFWSKFKLLSGQKSANPSPLLDGDNLVFNPRAKADLFSSSLQDTLQNYNGPPFSDERTNRINHRININPRFNLPVVLPEDDFSYELLSPISVAETSGAIFSGRDSAPGADSIRRRTLRRLPEAAFVFITSIFNICLKTGFFPKSWKEATIIMILKPGKDPRQPGSYRPISLLNVLGKTFEKIIKDRLQSFLNIKGIIPESQHGFRNQKCAQQAILQLQSDASIAINKNRCCLALLLDIERAFDRTWHNGLLFKLSQENIPLNFVRIIKHYLLDRTAQVKVQDSLSPPFSIKAGVPQGSVLAPLLFNFYMHDIPQPHHPSVHLAQYADDTAYWASAITSVRASQLLQTQIDLLQDWTNLWLVKANPEKSQLILFKHSSSRKKRLISDDINIKMQGSRVPLLTNVKYLGVTLNRHLNWYPEYQAISSKIYRKLNLLRAVHGKWGGCHPQTLIHTYKTFIRPLIEYRAVILAQAKPHILERLLALERRIIRSCLNLNPRYPSNLVHELAKLPPLPTRLQHLQSRYVLRTISSDNPSAKATLLSSLSTSARRPKNKLLLPSVALLQTAPDLPDPYQDILDSTPLPYRIYLS